MPMTPHDRKELLLTRIAIERAQLGHDLQQIRGAAMPSRWLPGALRQWAFGNARSAPATGGGSARPSAGPGFTPTAAHLTALILQVMALARRHRASLSLAGTVLTWLGRRKRWGGWLLLAGLGAAGAAWWTQARGAQPVDAAADRPQNPTR